MGRDFLYVEGVASPATQPVRVADNQLVPASQPTTKPVTRPTDILPSTAVTELPTGPVDVEESGK